MHILRARIRVDREGHVRALLSFVCLGTFVVVLAQRPASAIAAMGLLGATGAAVALVLAYIPGWRASPGDPMRPMVAGVVGVLALGLATTLGGPAPVSLALPATVPASGLTAPLASPSGRPVAGSAAASPGDGPAATPNPPATAATPDPATDCSVIRRSYRQEPVTRTTDPAAVAALTAFAGRLADPGLTYRSHQSGAVALYVTETFDYAVDVQADAFDSVLQTKGVRTEIRCVGGTGYLRGTTGWSPAAVDARLRTQLVDPWRLMGTPYTMVFQSRDPARPSELGFEPSSLGQPYVSLWAGLEIHGSLQSYRLVITPDGVPLSVTYTVVGSIGLQDAKLTCAITFTQVGVPFALTKPPLAPTPGPS